ncbi:MAG TPA: DUF222 domain-containing protein [Candidatus Nitrosopolaris sp.]|nr:DUF222 domain-containing protein [Candidatus Nitrosopolaris sp.]
MESGEGALAPQTGAEMLEELIRRRLRIDHDEIEFSLLAAKFAQTNEYDEQGFDSPIACIKATCHMRGGAAADRVCVGEQLERLDRSAEAVAAGEIGFPHLALMARTSVACGEKFDEARLLRHARKESVVKFEYTCAHARHAADPEGVVDEEKQGVEARSLTFSTAEDGCVLVKAILDKVGGATLRTALEPLAKRAGKDDHRDRERRLADALVELGVHGLDNGAPAQRPNVQVTTSLETLLGLCGAPAAEMEYSLPISSKAVERLACDCTVTRILLGSDSTVIDVGRARRVISGPQRKALRVRDQGCVWPGCDRPASWTSGHHLAHWIHGGATDLHNLILLCHRHHGMVHEGGWQIVRSDDGRMLTIPPVTEYRRLARGPD